MIKILRKVLGLCEHEYENIAVYTNVVHQKGKAIPVGKIYHQECTNCRKIRTFAP